MRTITRELAFDAGHRLVGHESKCRHLHGHRYTVQVTVLDTGLDSVGRVIDYSKIKEVVGGWIDENLDHNMILNSEDLLLFSSTVFGDKKPYILAHTNPTAENLVRHIADKAQELLSPLGIRLHSVRLYETPNCWADHTVI